MSQFALADACVPSISPLVIADRLITLAQDADRAGMQAAASRLIDLAYAALDERAPASFRVN